METIIEKYELLSMPVWSLKQIKEYFKIGNTQATKYKDQALTKHNGKVEFSDKYVKTDSVLALFGTNRVSELDILRKEYEVLQKIKS